MRTRIALLALLATGAAGFTCDGLPPYEPCAGKACGESCTACPPGTSDCVETAVVKACDPQGRCDAWRPDLCAGSDAPHPDCAGKVCGDECNPCGPEEICPTLIPSACDREGRCSGDVPWLCHDPCAGKACGEACTACPPPPEGAGCFETAEVKACDAAGRCTSRTPELVCP